MGYVDAPPPAPCETRGEWLASYGVPEEEWDRAAWLRDPHGVRPPLSIMPVPEGKVAKNRLHMDLGVPWDGSEDERWDRLRGFVDTLVAAGGQILQPVPKHHVVMADPEGNEFFVAFVGLDDDR